MWRQGLNYSEHEFVWWPVTVVARSDWHKHSITWITVKHLTYQWPGFKASRTSGSWHSKSFIQLSIHAFVSFISTKHFYCYENRCIGKEKDIFLSLWCFQHCGEKNIIYSITSTQNILKKIHRVLQRDNRCIQL